MTADALHAARWRARARKATIVVTLMAMNAPWATPAWSAVSQKPLLSAAKGEVLPNIVLTLDNSESMALHHMPELNTEINGKTVRLANTTKIILMHPLDTTSYASHTLMGNASGTVPGTISGLCQNIYECQMRSPQVNTIYYNPAVRYLPWRSATDTS